MKLDICIVLSPDDESVNVGECERGGVEGLSLDKPEVERPGGVHGSGSQATLGTVGRGMSGSWLNPNGGTVDNHHKPVPFVLGGMFRNGGVLDVGLLYCTVSVNNSPSLLLLATAQLADDDAAALPMGVLPTHKRHLRASPSARSQRPIFPPHHLHCPQSY
jgi:hypothetical protein